MIFLPIVIIYTGKAEKSTGTNFFLFFRSGLVFPENASMVSVTGTRRSGNPRSNNKGGFMNHKVSVWAACAALVVTITGCSCCQAEDPGKTQASKTPSKEHPCKAVTPGGEVYWIVAEWDACCTPGAQNQKTPCKNAKCWKTKDGKILCVKPLRKCPKNGKGCPAAEHFHSKAHNCMMCVQPDPASQQTGSCCDYAAKVVKPCPANGGNACKAKEHVNLPDGKKGCAPADKSAPPQASVPIEMDNTFESDEVFEVTSAN